MRVRRRVSSHGRASLTRRTAHPSRRTDDGQGRDDCQGCHARDGAIQKNRSVRFHRQLTRLLAVPLRCDHERPPTSRVGLALRLVGPPHQLFAQRVHFLQQHQRLLVRRPSARPCGRAENLRGRRRVRDCPDERRRPRAASEGQDEGDAVPERMEGRVRRAEARATLSYKELLTLLAPQARWERCQSQLQRQSGTQRLDPLGHRGQGCDGDAALRRHGARRLLQTCAGEPDPSLLVLFRRC